MCIPNGEKGKDVYKEAWLMIERFHEGVFLLVSNRLLHKQIWFTIELSIEQFAVELHNSTDLRLTTLLIMAAKGYFYSKIIKSGKSCCRHGHLYRDVHAVDYLSKDLFSKAYD